jgi:xanthine permease XanP
MAEPSQFTRLWYQSFVHPKEQLPYIERLQGLLDASASPGAHSGQITASFATAACALAVWATGLPKLFCSLIGILVGYAAAAAFHVFPPDFFTDYAAAPAFAIPDPSFLSYVFAPSFAVPFAIAGLASGLRVIGVLTTCQQTNDAAWRRPDMQNFEAGVRADGLGCLAGGLLRVPGMCAKTPTDCNAMCRARRGC